MVVQFTYSYSTTPYAKLRVAEQSSEGRKRDGAVAAAVEMPPVTIEELIRRMVGTNPKNLNAGPFDKIPPLIHAVALPTLSLVLWLLDEKGAGVNAKCPAGRTALYRAKSVEILTALMEHDTDPTLLDHLRRSALMLCVISRSPAEVEFLVRYPRARDTINLQDCHGNTCLHLASGNWSDDTAASMIHDLLEAGANAGIMNKDGETPSAYFRRWKPICHAAIALLEEAEEAAHLVKGGLVVATTSPAAAMSFIQGRMA